MKNAFPHRYQIMWVLAALFLSQVSLADLSLDVKMERQAARIQSLREELKTRAAQARTSGAPFVALTDNEWAQMLMARTADEEITSTDRKTLTELHDQYVNGSRMRAQEEALKVGISLDSLRGDLEQVQAFCRDLPKGGMLHVHTYGTMDRQTVRRILETVNPEIERQFVLQLRNQEIAGFTMEKARVDRFLNAVGEFTNIRFLALNNTQQELFLEFFFMEKGPYEFDHFMGIFRVVFQYFFTKKGVKPADMVWEAFLKRAQEQKVSYVEVSQNLTPTPEALTSLEKTVRGYEERVRASGEEVFVRILGAIDRMEKPQVNFEKVLKWLGLPKSGIFLGVNVVADEATHPARESQGAMGLLLNQPQLRRSFHAGELGDPNNVRDALVLGAERIGHGVKVREDVITLDLIRRSADPKSPWESKISNGPVSIEVNLTSNKKLGVVEDLRKHPWLRFLRLGVPVSFSTDDEGIFLTDMSQECVEAVTTTDVTYPELKEVMQNSLKTSFEEPVLKTRLLQKLESQLQEFEGRWRVH